MKLNIWPHENKALYSMWAYSCHFVILFIQPGLVCSIMKLKQTYGGWYRTSHTFAISPTTVRQNAWQSDSGTKPCTVHVFVSPTPAPEFSEFWKTPRENGHQAKSLYSRRNPCAALFCRTIVGEIATVWDVLY